MPEESFQERTERATPRRRKKARDEGRVAKSVELNSAIVLVLGITALFLIGPMLADRMMHMIGYTMGNASLLAMSEPSFQKVFGDQLVSYLYVVGPLFAIMTVIALSCNVAQVGFHITPKAMELKLEKLDLASGLKRLFSVRSLVTLARDTVKLLIVGYVAYIAISAEFDKFFLLPDMSVVQVASTMGRMALIVALKVGAIFLVIAALDYAYQRYDFEKSIRMSKQEVKDEYRDTEGSPQIKQRVRQIQRETARRRMMQDVPTADVVITNPVHLAVALRYSPEAANAPEVVAKGERLIAERIKEIAREHDIPIFEDKPLARALFKACDVGQLVPASLYRAVAEVLAYVYRLKGKVMK